MGMNELDIKKCRAKANEIYYKYFNERKKKTKEQILAHLMRKIRTGKLD